MPEKTYFDGIDVKQGGTTLTSVDVEDAEAREQLADLEDYVETLNSYSETTLFSGGDGTQSTFQLSDSIANYDQILVIARAEENSITYELTQLFVVSDLAQNVRYGIPSDSWYVYFSLDSNTQFNRNDYYYLYIYKIIGIKHGISS